jgi:predicted Zn-dependent peptidase
MKKIYNLKGLFYVLIFLFIFNRSFLTAQTEEHQNGKYTYTTVVGDPLNARLYKLDNGLTVYMTVNKEEPRIQTYIPVRAGSKYDPANTTGLAHYLEHMLFKGTDKFGTLDYSKEKPLLDKIIDLYEVYRSTTDKKKRKEIYHLIDSVSGEAAKYAIANEYDKMLASIGAKGTNAYTWVEQTVYVNDIPSNQIEKWVTIEAERYRNPVMRLFHTELEAVYEEKNIGLDEDGTKLWETLFANLFPTHQYGTQTTIGTIENLKNPSIKKVLEYYHTYYVPNNMAICLSGDFDPDEAIKIIDEKWGGRQPQTVPIYTPPVEKPITSPVVKEVFGPEQEELYIAYRFAGANTRESDLLTVLSELLSSGTAGLMDLNLVQKQKVLSANAFAVTMKDYSAFVLDGKPRDGQKLEEVKDLLLGQLEEVKKGNFPDWQIPAIVDNFKLSRIKSFESNRSRANAFVEAFVLGVPWDEYINDLTRISGITKQDVIDFANKYFGDNYIAVYKRQGTAKEVEKVEKPKITPVTVNRQAQSDFLKTLINTPAPDIKPQFVDYANDIKTVKLKNDIPVYYRQNTENNLFNLYYVLDMGTNNDKKLGLAISYLEYLGTSKYTSAQLKQEFYKLASSFSVSSSEDQIFVSLSGLNDNFEKGVELFEEFLNDAQPNKEALDNLVNDILKVRSDDKTSQDKILWDGMLSYAKYGVKSPFTNVLTQSELKSIQPEELLSILKNILGYKHLVLYYGPKELQEVTDVLNSKHVKGNDLKPLPELVTFTEVPTEENKVYFVNYNDMVQAQIIFISKVEPYNVEKLPIISMYNEYFGSGMSGIVFQEMRESKALAYSVFSSYTKPRRKENSHYIMSYIGTQADKLPEAMNGMLDLLNNMPESENSYDAAKNSLKQQMQSSRVTRSGVLFDYLSAKKLGLDYDVRKSIYDKIPDITLDDVKAFQQSVIKGRKYTILVLGDEKKVDMKTLESFGKITKLSLEEVFGY